MLNRPGTQAKVICKAKSVESVRRKLNQFIVVSLTITLCLFLSISQSFAISHQAYLSHDSSVKSKNARSIGYHLAEVEKLSRIAVDAFEADEYQLALRIWSSLAEQGQAEAAYRLGMMYDMGLGADRDSVKAAYWYQRSAEAGHVHAQHNLAVAYANGEGVDLNINKAMRWWKAAARSGNSDSQYNLGIVYAMGVHGIRKNIEMAKKWWRKAAIEGDAMAQYNLGTIYANGEGQVTSYCEATRWWEKSASKGIQQASWALEIIKSRKDYDACW